jgi:hypothetical protein
MNKFTNQGIFIEIVSHIDGNIIDLIKATNLNKVEWVQFRTMEPNENDLVIINDFFKEFPEIYLRWINPNWLKYLPNLQKFRMSFMIESFEKIKNHKVVGLYLENSLSKKDDLTIINQFNETLEELHIEGEAKNADKIISQFKRLKKLGLSSVKLNDLNFLENINLEYFYNYGSRVKDFSYLGNINSLKTLYLKTNTTLDNLDFIANLSKLEYILIMYFSNITYFPNSERLKNIKNITLAYCNRLENIEEIKKLENVEVRVSGKLVKYKKMPASNEAVWRKRGVARLKGSGKNEHLCLVASAVPPA